MVRHAQRSIFTPLGIMAHAPNGWVLCVVFSFMLVTWPWRYRIARYLEMHKGSPQQGLKSKAIFYYLGLDRMHRRAAGWMSWTYNCGEDHMEAKIMAHQNSTSIQMGVTDTEEMYWMAYKRDVQRAERLVEEIRDLKIKTGAKPATAAA
eukprot:PhF_6_TR17318/c0_g1_i1/m.26536